jgi:myosin-15
VPSQASDVDQFLDDLFNPVLDQLSDARSLAASIKGGSSKSKSVDDCESLDSRNFAKTIKGGVGRHTIEKTCDPASASNESPSQTEYVDTDDEQPLDIAMFAKTIKGGGRGVASQQQVRCRLFIFYDRGRDFWFFFPW